MDSPIHRLLRTHLMTTSADSRVLQPCVPVSATARAASLLETHLAKDTRTDKARQAFLIGVLIHTYGWTLGQDGNLYSPNPAETGWGERVA